MKFTTPLLLAVATCANALPATNEQTDLSGSLRFASSTWQSAVSSILGWVQETVDDISTEALDAHPGHHHWPHAAPDKSVYQWVKDQDKFTKLTKLIEKDEEIVKILDGASHGLTFFAPNNDAIPDPPKKDEPKDLFSIKVHDRDALSHLYAHLPSIGDLSSLSDKNDDKDDEKRKKMFKAILRAVLLYHTVPEQITSINLGLNSTIPSNYKASDAASDGLPRRIKVERTTVPPSVTLNGYVTLLSSNNEATNGLVHEVDHPLFPPPSALDIAFLLPQWLSTLTSSIQKVDLQSAVQWHHHSKDSKDTSDGTPSLTLFAPNNAAFAKLPEKLILYLFSPFGERALKKLLAFHVAPDYIVFSESFHKVKKEKKDAMSVEASTEFDFYYEVPTALGNYTLPVRVVKTLPTLPIPGVSYIDFDVLGTKVIGHDLDIVARNGAIHVIHSVLDPRKSPAHKDSFKPATVGEDGESDWEDWEEWLPQWAGEE